MSTINIDQMNSFQKRLYYKAKEVFEGFLANDDMPVSKAPTLTLSISSLFIGSQLKI